MAKSGDIMENPVTGERLRWHLTAADTGNRLARAEMWVQPGGKVLGEQCTVAARSASRSSPAA